MPALIPYALAALLAAAQQAYLVDLRLYAVPLDGGETSVPAEPGYGPVLIREGESAEVAPGLRVSVIGGALMWNGRADGQRVGVEQIHAPQFQVAAGQRAAMELAPEPVAITYLEPVDPRERLYRAVTAPLELGYRADLTVSARGPERAQVELEAAYALAGGRAPLPGLELDAGPPQRVEAAFTASFEAPLEAWTCLRRRTPAGLAVLMARVRPGGEGAAGLPEPPAAPAAGETPLRPAAQESMRLQARVRRLLLPAEAAAEALPWLLADPGAVAPRGATVFRAADPAAWLEPGLGPLEGASLTPAGPPLDVPQLPYSGERVINGQSVSVIGYAKRIDDYQNVSAVVAWLRGLPGVRAAATPWFTLRTGGRGEDDDVPFTGLSEALVRGDFPVTGPGAQPHPGDAWQGELYGLRFERAEEPNWLVLSGGYDLRRGEGTEQQGRFEAPMRLRHWLGFAAPGGGGETLVLIAEARPAPPAAEMDQAMRLRRDE